VASEVICCSGACVHGILAGQLPAHLVPQIDSLVRMSHVCGQGACAKYSSTRNCHVRGKGSTFVGWIQ